MERGNVTGRVIVMGLLLLFLIPLAMGFFYPRQRDAIRWMEDEEGGNEMWTRRCRCLGNSMETGGSSSETLCLGVPYDCRCQLGGLDVACDGYRFPDELAEGRTP